MARYKGKRTFSFHFSLTQGCALLKSLSGPKIYQVLIPSLHILDILNYLHSEVPIVPNTFKRAQTMCLQIGITAAMEKFCGSCMACESMRKPLPQ